MKLVLDQPTILLGTSSADEPNRRRSSQERTKFGLISEQGEVLKIEDVAEPFKLVGGRYEVNVSLMLEGGQSTAATADGGDYDIPAGLFWGFKHPSDGHSQHSHNRTTGAIHFQNAGFKGLELPPGMRERVGSLVSLPFEGIAHSHEGTVVVRFLSRVASLLTNGITRGLLEVALNPGLQSGVLRHLFQNLSENLSHGPSTSSRPSTTSASSSSSAFLRIVARLLPLQRRLLLVVMVVVAVVVPLPSPVTTPPTGAVDVEKEKHAVGQTAGGTTGEPPPTTTTTTRDEREAEKKGDIKKDGGRVVC